MDQNDPSPASPQKPELLRQPASPLRLCAHPGPGPDHRQVVSQGLYHHHGHKELPAQVPRGLPRLDSITLDYKSFSSFQALHMVNESEDALNFIKDMSEEHIISTEEAASRPGLW